MEDKDANIKKSIKRLDYILYMITVFYIMYFVITSIGNPNPVGIIIVNLMMLASMCTVLFIVYINIRHDKSVLLLQVLTFIVLIIQHLILSALILYFGYKLAETDMTAIANYGIFIKITNLIIVSNVGSFLLKYVVEALTVIRQYKISKRG